MNEDDGGIQYWQQAGQWESDLQPDYRPPEPHETEHFDIEDLPF